MEEKKLTRIPLVPAREEGKAHGDNRDGLQCAGWFRDVLCRISVRLGGAASGGGGSNPCFFWLLFCVAVYLGVLSLRTGTEIMLVAWRSVEIKIQKGIPPFMRGVTERV